ncbi:MAG: hypothetical protein WAM53_15260 [Terrimicrobiaceae bacterium]
MLAPHQRVAIARECDALPIRFCLRTAAALFVVAIGQVSPRKRGWDNFPAVSNYAAWVRQTQAQMEEKD